MGSCTLKEQQFDFQAELKFFISVIPSANTRASYRASLRIFENWLGRRYLAPTEVTPVLAAEFIKDLGLEKMVSSEGHRRSKASMQTIVVACRAFYVYIERRYADMTNPFRGIRVASARREGGYAAGVSIDV